MREKVIQRPEEHEIGDLIANELHYLVAEHDGNLDAAWSELAEQVERAVSMAYEHVDAERAGEDGEVIVLPDL